MRKLYEKHELWFAVLWIVAYCVVMSFIKGNYGYDSVVSFIALTVFASGITVFVKRNDLSEKYGLSGWPNDSKKCLYFIPMWIVATGNLWDGFAPSYKGTALLFALLSMVLVGYVEEMIFRGFLFKAMLSGGRTSVAVIVSSLTFGIGHLFNLLAGQTSFESLVQVVFAVSWGFIFTMVYYRGGSIIPCIIAHAMVDVFAMLGTDNVTADWIYIGATIIVAVLYCIYLARLKGADQE